MIMGGGWVREDRSRLQCKIQDLRGLREGKRFHLPNFVGGIQKASVGQQPREGFNNQQAEVGAHGMCNGER